MQRLSVAALMVAGAVADETASPIAKTLEMISALEAKIIKEGEAAQKEYDEYAEWCSDRSKNVGFEIETGKGNVEELKAHIDEQKALQTELTSKIDDLAGSIATAEADLKSATAIRKSESEDFAAEEKDLSSVIDTLERAIRVISRGGASMVQLKSASSITEALGAMVQASMFSQADASKLTALVQSSQQSDDDEEENGAPAAATYESKSGGIVDTLEGLLEKAQEELSSSRQKEETALHNFEMLAQSLKDELKFGNKDATAAKTNRAASSEKQAVAEGELDVTSKDLAEDLRTLGGLHQNCMTRATDFESEAKSRGEELGALASAKKVIAETSGGAAAQTYALLQISRSKISSGADLAKFEAVQIVRALARKEGSAALAQLASRMQSVMRMSVGEGQDPFAKVKGMIENMITKLESDADSEASHKAYCDKELAEANEKKADEDTTIAKLSTAIDQMTARSANLKAQVATLQKELAEAAKSKASWDKFRKEENTAYKSNKAEMEEGLGGIKTALKVLRDYYAKKQEGSAQGSASGIIGLLEVVESDLSKGLAEMTAVEENAQATYDVAVKENEISVTAKNQDVKYKTKEAVGLDKAVSEHTADRSGSQAELDAVVEYLEKLKDMCVAKAEPYEEIVRRRTAEIAGLKDALGALGGEVALLQKAQRSLRGVSRH